MTFVKRTVVEVFLGFLLFVLFLLKKNKITTTQDKYWWRPQPQQYGFIFNRAASRATFFKGLFGLNFLKVPCGVLNKHSFVRAAHVCALHPQGWINKKRIQIRFHLKKEQDVFSDGWNIYTFPLFFYFHCANMVELFLFSPLYWQMIISAN